jgi:nucleotide-binding universal stress UspA family protein
VVCAVDCSPTSPATLAQAVAMADEAHGELTVVNVVDIAFSTVPPEVVRASAEKALADLHHDPGGQIAHWCQIQDVVRFGDAATEVLKVAVGLDAQLIVVGARSRRPAVAAMVGSAADRIVRDSPCPVLAVPSAPVPLAVPALQPVYA